MVLRIHQTRVGLLPIGRRGRCHRHMPMRVGEAGHQHTPAAIDRLFGGGWICEAEILLIVPPMMSRFPGLRLSPIPSKMRTLVIRMEAVSYTHLTLPTNREV